MTSSLVCVAVIVGMLTVSFFGLLGAIDRMNAQREHDRIRKELENEILHGGNVSRIASLRKRLLALEDSGCRRV